MKIRVRVEWRREYFWPIIGIVFVVSGVMSLVFLRMNNENMARLRQTLIAADQSEDIGQVQEAAKDLQRYVANHMNANTGRVALQSMYNRDAATALASVRPTEVDESAYQVAAEECRGQLNSYGYRAWASCVADRVGTNPAATSLIEADVAPDPDLYYIDYVSARWSSDPAGWCIVILIISGVMLLAKLILVAVKWVRRWLQRHPINTRVLTPIKH